MLAILVVQKGLGVFDLLDDVSGILVVFVAVSIFADIIGLDERALGFSQDAQFSRALLLYFAHTLCFRFFQQLFACHIARKFRLVEVQGRRQY